MLLERAFEHQACLVTFCCYSCCSPLPASVNAARCLPPMLLLLLRCCCYSIIVVAARCCQCCCCR